ACKTVLITSFGRSQQYVLCRQSNYALHGRARSVGLCVIPCKTPSPAQTVAACRERSYLRYSHLFAVIAGETGGDGWESNPPRTPQQRPADGFEDRGEHQLPYIPDDRVR